MRDKECGGQLEYISVHCVQLCVQARVKHVAINWK